MNELAKCHLVLGQSDEAFKLCSQALESRKALLGPDHPDTLRSMLAVATSLAALGRHSDALALYEKTLQLQKASLGADHADTLWTEQGLAAALSALGRHAEALKFNERILVVRKARLGTAHVDTLRAQMQVADNLFQVGRGAEAAALARQAAEGWENQNQTNAAHFYYAALCRALATAAIRATDKSASGARAADAEADKAIARLKQAVAAGWLNAAAVAADHVLDGLRGRPDFQQLAARIGGPTPP